MAQKFLVLAKLVHHHPRPHMTEAPRRDVFWDTADNIGMARDMKKKMLDKVPKDFKEISVSIFQVEEIE